jgi:signal transduction histidine kinase/ActR/RegA family two-component response regulator
MSDVTAPDGARVPLDLLAPHLGSVVCYRVKTGGSAPVWQVAGDTQGLLGRPVEAFSGPQAPDLESLVWPADRARVKRESDGQLSRGDGFSVQYRLTRADGTEVWVRESGRCPREPGADGCIREGLIADIMAQRRASQRLSRLEQDFDRSRSLLYAVSEAMAAHVLVVDGAARSVAAAAKALMAILNDILDLSKLESGRMDLESIPFSLLELTTDAAETIGNEAARKGLEFHFSIDDRLAPCVRGDPTKLRQVLLNLLGNAVKFTPAGTVTLDLRPGPGNDEVHVSVSDTGIGIAPENVERVFERFSQADQSMTRRFGGTGLGTAISRGIIEGMGGRIWVESQEGRGSCFQFIVPLPAVDQPVACGGQDDARQPGDLWTRPLRVLLVEDIPLNQELVVLRLAQRHHEIGIAGNGLEALECLARESFDLVLMDAHMPVLNGFDAIRAIRTRERETGGHVPIIMLTASVLPSDQQQCVDSGADDFVGKPIDFDDLYRKIARHFPSFSAPP